MKKILSPAALCVYAAAAIITVTIFIFRRRTNNYA